MEQLIALVKGQPILYNKNHPDYMKTSLKDEIWARLAAELGYRDGGDIKEQWRKLRECHREALRRQYNRSLRNQGLFPTKMWMYQKQMEFLLPFMTQRVPDTTHLQENADDEYAFQFKAEDSSEDQPSTSEADHHQPRPKKKRQEEDSFTVSEPLVYDKRPEMEGRGQLTVDNDCLYDFFMCMYNTAKNMPLSHQLKVKKEIFQVVVDAEEELIHTSIELGVHHLV